MYEIRIELDDRTTNELMPLYEETNRLFAAAGDNQWTFEDWYKMMLLFGSTPHVKANAELLNKQEKNKLDKLNESKWRK